MANRFHTKNLLKAHNLAPHKKLGQNFLVDPNCINQILDKAQLEPDDTVLEVGVGLGALTLPLAQRVKQVIGLEVDSGIVELHQQENTFPDNVTVLHQDVLQYDFSSLLLPSTAQRLKIIANLPYSISNPFLFQLIEQCSVLDSAVIMLQKEVGARLMAQPNSKEYGVLSVLMRSVASVKKLLTLGPQHFHPPPKVDSMVVAVSFHTNEVSTLPSFDNVLLKTLVKTAFQQRRKRLCNALASAPYLSRGKQEAEEKILAAGLSPSLRPDKLALVDYIALTNIWRNE